MTGDTSSAQLYRRLLSYVTPYRGVFAVAILAMAITAATEVGFAALLRPIMDKGFVDPDPAFIQWVPFLLIGVVMGRAISGFISTYCMAWVGRRVIFDLRRDSFQQLVYSPSSFYDDHSSATLVSKLIYDVERAASATTDALTLMTRDAFTALALIGWMFYLDWKLALAFLVFSPIVTFIVHEATRRFRRTSERIQDSVGGIAHVAKEMILAQRVVKTYGGQRHEIDSFTSTNEYNRRQEMKRTTVSAAMVPMVVLFAGTAIALVVYLAVTRSGANAISAGTFVSFLGTVLMLMGPLKRLAKVNEKIQMGVAAAGSIFSLIDEPREHDPGGRELQKANGHIEYQNVSFQYIRAKQPVLQDVSFTIESGQTVALVGSSGSGKSTVAALLLGFYRPDSGAVKVDGVDIREIKLANLRSHIAIVTQEVVLFDDTVRNNIIYGYVDEVSETRLQQAVAAAHVVEFMETLPRGLDTMIGEQGVRLSGGQRQRIAIARALYKDAPILILDEATSSLDTISERLVQDAMDKLMVDRTTLVIAHRLSTIENADQILVLEHGRIVESGRHPELIAGKGEYAALYRSQLHEERLAG